MTITPEHRQAWYQVDCAGADRDTRREVIARFALRACDEETAIDLVDRHLTDEIYHVSLGGWKPKTMAEAYDLPEPGQSHVQPLSADLVSLFNKAVGDHVRLISYEEQHYTE